MVTGGAGFLGSHLCHRLLDAGHRVLAVDDLSTGSMDNLADLLGQSRFSFVRHDVTQPLERPVGAIFDLACRASPVHYQADPEKTLLTCVDGALHALHLARARGARVLLASTSEVYGEPEVHPQQESYRGSVNTTGPRACYDEGKRCAETLFFDAHRTHGTEIKVARIFNTYGPRMQVGDGRVVSNLIVQALRGEPLTIHGDGSQTRSFCYVDDLVEGLLRLMSSPTRITGPINLGNPCEITVLELAERILALTGSRSPLVKRPMPVDDPTRRCPDITQARTLLDWKPEVDLEEGLKRTIAWFEASLSKLNDATAEAANASA
jgi:UDP-glucuronate decarboxylase